MPHVELLKTTALELPGAAFFIVDRQYNYVLAGGAGLAVLGLSPEDFKGRSVREVVPAKQLPIVLEDYDAVFANRTFKREHSVGSRHYESHGQPVRITKNSALDYALVVSYDITERKQSEQRADILVSTGEITRKSTSEDDIVCGIAALLRSKLDVAGVFFSDIASYGETAPSNVKGRACEGEEGHVADTALICPSLPVQMADCQSISSCLQQVRLRYAHFDEVLDIPFSAVLLRVPSTATGHEGICAVLTETVGRVWVVDEIELLKEVCAAAWQSIEKHRSLEQLRVANIKQNRFMAVLGHELRNPLAAIKSALDLMQISQLPQHSERAKAVFTQQFSQINRLMDDLAAISQANTPGDQTLKLDRVDMRALVDNAIRAIHHSATKKAQTITASLSIDPIYLTIDEVRITQAVNNLLSNAIKYTPEGGLIDVALGTVGQTVELRVHDNGIGMSEETLAGIFDMYGRGREALAQAQDGLGVGMWLAKRFVEAHGGQVVAISPGVHLGSTFIMTLPDSPFSNA